MSDDSPSSATGRRSGALNNEQESGDEEQHQPAECRESEATSTAAKTSQFPSFNSLDDTTSSGEVASSAERRRPSLTRGEVSGSSSSSVSTRSGLNQAVERFLWYATAWITADAVILNRHWGGGGEAICDDEAFRDKWRYWLLIFTMFPAISLVIVVSALQLDTLFRGETHYFILWTCSNKVLRM